MSARAVRIGELADTIRGVTYEKHAARCSPADGYTALLRATNINDGKLDFDDLVFVPDRFVRDDQRLQVGDILLAASSGSSAVVGKAALLRNPFRGTFGAFCYTVRPRQGAILPQYLAHYMQTLEYRSRVSALAAGVNINNLRREHIQDIEIPFVGLAQQQRIIEVIDSYNSRLDAAVATLARAQARLVAYRASVLKAAVEGRLVPTEAELARAENRDYEPAHILLERILAERRLRWEEAEFARLGGLGKVPANDKYKAKYREPTITNISKLAALPEGWCWTTVESLSTRVVDGVHQKPTYVDNGVPFVTVKNLTAGPQISFESLKYISPTDHEQFVRRANPEWGDILVSKDGTLGVIRAIRTQRVFSIFVSVALIKVIDKRMTDYLEYALASPQVQAQMVPKGSGLEHIHLEDLRVDCVPLPPIAEQQRIARALDERLSVVDWLREEIPVLLRRCKRLRRSMLKSAFEGKLNEQDPADEPAENLLERIRAERASSTSAKPTRSRKSKAAR